MKYLSLLIPVSIILSISCQHNIKPLENYEKPLNNSTLTYKEIFLKIDCLTLSVEYYTSFDFYNKNGEILFFGYNPKTHNLDVINLTNRRVEKHIKLEKQGPDAVGMRITGMNVVSYDSILIDDESRFVFMNSDGLVFWRLSKNNPNLLKGIPKGNLLTQVEAFKPGYSKKTGSLYVIYQPFEKKYLNTLPIILEIDTDSLTSSFVPVYYPEVITANKNSYKPIYGGPQACFTEDKIIVNFAFESNIYVYNLKSKKVTPFGGKSNFTPNQSPPYAESSNPEDYRLTTINFHPLIYDPYRNYYYRTHWGEMNLKKTEFEYNNWPDKPVFLTIFDHEFNVLFETKLEIKNGIVPAHLFPSPEGLIVFPWKQDVADLQEDQVKGIVINVTSMR